MYVENYNWEYLWIVVTGFVVSFCMAFAIGANDVANSFGTTVGSKVLTIRQACIFAVVFEILGSMLLGTRVSETLWREIVDISVYRGQERILILGEMSVLIGSATWVLTATFLKVPVSGTHAIVGATVGFSILKQGLLGIHWIRLVGIAASWFISPLLAGIVSGSIFVIVRRYILESADPMESGLKFTPVLYALTIFINVLSIFLDGWLIPDFMDKLPWWATLILSTGMGLLTAIVVRFFFVPLQRKRINRILDMQRAFKVSFRRRTVATISVSEHENTVVRSIQRTERSVSSASSKRPPRHLKKRLSAGNALNQLDREEFLAEIRYNKVITESNNSAFGSPEADETSSEEDEEDAIFEFQTDPVTSCSQANINNMLSGSTDEHAEIIIPTETNTTEREVMDDNDSSVRFWKLRLCCWHGPGESVTDVIQAAKKDQDQPEIAFIFSYLQIVTSALTAFAHGGNDVCNAVGPLMGIWTVFTNERFQDDTRIPFWLLCFGGLGISFGLCILGRKVIETVGTTLTNILPSSGFCIGLGAACTVLIASKLGLPVSTTHCIVGSVVAVGWLRARGSVNWKVFGSIMGCALMTLPVAAGCGAAAMALLCLLPA